MSLLNDPKGDAAARAAIQAEREPRLTDDAQRAQHREERAARAGMTDEQRARLAYPNTKLPEPEPEAQPDCLLVNSDAPKLNPDEEAARKYFSGTYKEATQRVPDEAVPEAIRQLRAEDPERAMFSPQVSHADVISPADLALSEGAEGEGLAPEGQQQVAFEIREILGGDLGLSNVEAKEIVTLAKGGAPDEGTAQQWIAESTKLLLDRNSQNVEKARDDLAFARALVARDPRVAHILDITGLGNHPKVVTLLAQKARAEHARGRLKNPKKS